MSFTTKMIGLNQLQSYFSRTEDKLKLNLPRGMKAAVLFVQGELPPYPAETPNSDRTGTLGKVLTAFGSSSPVGENRGTPLSNVEEMNGRVVGVIGGRLNYLGWVVDEETQAAVHKGRWWVLQKVVRGLAGKIADVIAEKGVRPSLD